MTARREGTTEHIRRAAIDELSETGPRAFSLQQVAKRAFVSVGAVYERWSSKDECLDDIVTREAPACARGFEANWLSDLSPAAIARRELTDPEALANLRLLAECVFAARDESALIPPTRAALDDIMRVTSSRVPVTGAGTDLGWWITSTWIGYALLRTSGCSIPDTFVSAVALILDGVEQLDELAPPAPSLHTEHGPIEPGRSTEGDETATALVDATRKVIAERGVGEANARVIANEAGVTTGALYRRFEGKSDVLARALHAELPPERYAWTSPLMQAMDDHGLEGAAAFLAGLTQRIWSDEASARMLLEFTIAAHTDQRVLAAILTEIVKVATARTELFAQLQTAGIIRSDIPAEALSWLLQVPPVGMRLLASIGVTPNKDELGVIMLAYLLFLTDTP